MPQYIPMGTYRGFNSQKIRFGVASARAAKKTDLVILTHINLSLIGIAIKLFNPKCKVWLIAHGIEVWRPLNWGKKTFLRKYCDKIVCVSNFTREQMINRHHSAPTRYVILNNAVDPFIKLPASFEKPEYLLNRYGLDSSSKVIFTLTRLASSEQYKGHEQVIKALGVLKHSFPDLKYVLSGQYDTGEEMRIRNLIRENDVADEVILTGFLDEKELADHFLMSDLFVLPSKKEGFGIVFVEALTCGLPVICGNADGSTDAIRNGKLGTSINADDLNELEGAIVKYLNIALTDTKRRQLQSDCLRYFGEEHYRNNLFKMMTDEFAA
jgi:glycosyltransferase involved in cell wall biosynthesis